MMRGTPGSTSETSPTQRSLCSACQNFCNEVCQRFEAPEKEDIESGEIVWPTHSAILHRSSSSLTESAESGCFICKLIRVSVIKAVSWNLRHLLPELSDVRLSIEPRDRNPGQKSGFAVLSAAVYFPDPAVHPLRRMLAWYNTPPEARLASALRRCAAAEDTSTGSDAAFILAAYWLDNCLHNHSCSRRRNAELPPVKLPSRVIDVGSPDGSQEPFLHITTASDSGPYVALSHCWGKEQLITTCIETLKDRCAGIPFSTLPNTFRDAVRICRRFEIRYLWIDSLCIIQNSQEDWAAESKTMCRIYQDCLFTIAAGHADGARKGCFVQRDGELHRARELPIRPHFLKSDDYFESWFQPVVPTLPPDSPVLPLHTRAWVLQEQVLAPRTLLFGEDEVHWVCMAMHGSERSPQGGISRHMPFMKALREYVGGAESEAQMAEYKDQWSFTWRNAVHEYTVRSLTQWSDKLVAIYGIADALRGVFRDDYLFGLWRQDLWRGLLWYVPVQPSEFALLVDHPSHQTYPACRPDKYLGPSWSWVSAESAMVYYDIPNSHMSSLNCVCRITNIHEIPDLDGNPHKAEITIEADARIGYVNCSYSWKDMLPPAQSSSSIHESYSRFLPVPAIENASWSPEEAVNPTTALTFVAIAEAPGDSGFLDREASSVYALGIVPIDQEKKRYRRVGLATWNRCSWYGYSCVPPSDSKVPEREEGSSVSKYMSDIAKKLQISSSKHVHPVKIDTFVDASVYKKGTKVERMTVTIV